MAHPLELFRQRYGDPQQGRYAGYSHLINVATVTANDDDFLPGLVLPGAVVQRGTPDEADEIKFVLDSYAPELAHEWRNPLETQFERVPFPKGPPGSWGERASPLPPEAWRYVVLRYAGTNALAHSLADASVLTPKHLQIGVEVGLSPMMSVTTGVSARFIKEVQHESDDDAFVWLGPGDITELADVHDRFLKHDDAIVPLRAAVTDYRDLRGVPRGSRLRFLGYCSLLESLLAHLPNKDDPTESLTRQVRQKMGLLERRFRHPLSFTEFGATPHERVWTKLYHLRSWIAHGTPPDFAKEFHVLGDLAKATRFIAGATWRVMRQALDEPQLVADLRIC